MPVANDRLSKLQVLKLIQAVNEKDHEQIKKIVQHGLLGLVNFSEPSKLQSGLHIAAAGNDVDTIKLLASFGADCNTQDKDGETPFIKAAKYGHIQSLKCLLEVCATPQLNLVDNDGLHILYHCLHETKRHYQCLETAIHYGANVHFKNKDGKTLLIIACESGLEKIVKILLQSGCDSNFQTEATKETALHLACLYGYEECVRHLLKYNADPNIADESGRYAVHNAAIKGSLPILQLLSAYKGDFNVTCSAMNTAMHYAAVKGFGPICKYLAQRGCPANVKNLDGVSARRVAKDNNNKKVAKECLKAEKLKRNKPGTEIHLIKFYDWLVENKKSIELGIKEYETTEGDSTTKLISKNDLMIVLQSHVAPLYEDQLNKIFTLHGIDDHINYEQFLTGKKFINKQFLMGGAKSARKNSSRKKGGKQKKVKVEYPIYLNVDQTRNANGGPRVSYIEKLKQRTDTTRFDRDHPPQHPIQDDSFWYTHQRDTSFVHIRECIQANDKESLKNALANGFDINHKDKYNKTPLMTACIQGNISIVKYLLDEGADVNGLDNFKWTALHFACHMGVYDITQLLLDNGALIDSQSVNGGTPIMRAIESSKKSIVQLLLERGAKIQIQNKKGETALDIAKSYSDPRIIQLIQAKWDTLPPLPSLKDKKKKGKKKSNVAVKNVEKPSVNPRMPNLGVSDEEKDIKPRRLKSSGKPKLINTDIKVADSSIFYQPKQAWLPEPKTEELFEDKKVRRIRFGHEIDYDDYQPPYQKHISDLVRFMDIKT